jgi:hypothetical protein
MQNMDFETADYSGKAASAAAAHAQAQAAAAAAAARAGPAPPSIHGGSMQQMIPKQEQNVMMGAMPMSAMPAHLMTPSMSNSPTMGAAAQTFDGTPGAMDAMLFN